MTFDWRERELVKEVAITFLLFVAILSKPILCLLVACFFFFDLFGKLLAVFENLKL